MLIMKLNYPTIHDLLSDIHAIIFDLTTSFIADPSFLTTASWRITHSEYDDILSS